MNNCGFWPRCWLILFTALPQLESVRAKMRIEVRKLLARYGYPPDLQRAAVDLVIQQAEELAGARA
jgi:Domain of unknown function (DUF3387)